MTSHSRRRLWAVFFGLMLCTVATAVLSHWFTLDTPNERRPVLWTLAGWAVAGGLYLIALSLGRHLPNDRHSCVLVFGGAVLLRAVLWPTPPVLEIDLYRYIWDGNVTEAGVSPFRYSPSDVLTARAFSTNDAALQRLVDKVEAHDGLTTVLNTVHFGHLRTPYPVTSQAAFAVSAWVTPDDAGTPTHVLTMKLVLALFDLGTVALVMHLLWKLGRSVGEAVAYAWCPLVLKEFANSGHLDAVAVFCSVLAVTLVVPRVGTSGRPRWWAAAFVLAVATAAKLFPVVFAPVLAVRAAKERGVGTAVGCGAVFVIAATALFLPMRPPTSEVESPTATNLSLAPPGDSSDDGLVEFLKRWEINDVLFAVVVENLKPAAIRGELIEPWFSVVPEAARVTLLDATRVVHNGYDAQAFLVARAIVALVYVALTLWFMRQAWRAGSSGEWLTAIFLAVAWAWLLAPTQNPWYWTWALPWLPFARAWAWRLIGVVAMAYYARFWCEYHGPSWTFGGVTYDGVNLFDFVLVWVEFAPFWLVLVVECFRRRQSSTSSRESSFHATDSDGRIV